jgi:hypothetical protein
MDATTRLIPSHGVPDLNLIDNNGKIKLLSHAEYRAMDQEALRIWMHYQSRYLLPTQELISWLKDYIGGRSAIEIGAGTGDLGYHLDIPMTDNKCQQWPDVAMYYRAMAQPVIKYGQDVETIDALDAVRQYKPEVVIGAWVTHWIDPKLPPPPGGGSMYGIKEDALLSHVKEYVMIGSEAIHHIKPIRKLPHKTINAMGWVVSRSNRGDDKIWIWKGRKPWMKKKR